MSDLADRTAEALKRLAFGARHPFDGPDEDNEGRLVGDRTVRPDTWAYQAARGVIADLSDRAVIKWGFDDVDAETRREIVDALAAIIEAAEAQWHERLERPYNDHPENGKI